MKILFILLFIIPLHSFSQKEIELYLGDYYTAFVKPPVGWNETPSMNNEKCFYKTGGEVSICIKARSRNDRTLTKVLEEYLSGLSTIKCETKEAKNGDLQGVWKECTASVGPRTEGRIYTVISYKNTRNVIIVDVNLTNGITE